MTARRLVLIGGGEHARVVAEAAGASGWTPVGYTAADSASPSIDLPLLGSDADLAALLEAMQPEDRPALILGFGGSPAARRAAVAVLPPDATWAAIVHPSAWVSPTATVGAGSVILAGAVVNAGARIGPHAIVNSRAVVEHDVRIGAHAHVGPGATIGGGTTVGEDALVGLGAAVRDHVSVGRAAVVAMGAVVVDDVAVGAVVIGVPARPRPSADGGGSTAGGAGD